MKKALKWIGIAFVALVIIAAIFGKKSDNTANSQNVVTPAASPVATPVTQPVVAPVSTQANEPAAAHVKPSETAAASDGNSENIIREGECYGAMTAALNLGNKVTVFAVSARTNAFKISEKYESITNKWGSIAKSCTVGVADTDSLFKCFREKITDKKAFAYFKGFYAALNTGGQHSALVAQTEANALCVTINP
jgi:hypothetical protein